MNKQALIKLVEGMCHPDNFKDGSHKVKVVDVIELLEAHLPDNEVSVPVDPTEAMIEVGANTIICFNFKDRMSEAYESKEIYKAMIQAQPSEEV